MSDSPILDVGFPLSADFAVSRNAILAISGAGKSNAAVRIAEELYRAGIPWFTLDPKGDHWGMRSAADGEGPGLPIPIFGGEHGDVPLTRDSGPMIARLIAHDRVTCIIDLSGEEFAVRSAMFHFIEAFASTLLRINRTAVHGFLEEADDYLPQNPREGGPASRALGAMQRLVKRGRQKGIGTTMVTQRAAAINKDALNMAETLVAMRVQASLDVKAVQDWLCGPVRAADITSEDRELLASLSTLADGEAWVISPHALGLRERVRFGLRTTFDSGRTPDLGEVLAPPSTLADVDVAGLGKEVARMAAEAAEDDPDLLRAERDELRGERDHARADLASLGSELEAMTARATEAERLLVEERLSLENRLAESVVAAEPRVITRTVEVVPPAVLEALRLNVEALGKLVDAAPAMQRQAEEALAAVEEVMASP